MTELWNYGSTEIRNHGNTEPRKYGMMAKLSKEELREIRKRNFDEMEMRLKEMHPEEENGMFFHIFVRCFSSHKGNRQGRLGQPTGAQVAACASTRGCIINRAFYKKL